MTVARTLTALGVITAMLVPLIGVSAPAAHAAVQSATTDLLDGEASVSEPTETMSVPDLDLDSNVDVDSQTAVPAPSDVPYLAPTLTDQDQVQVQDEEPEVVGPLADIRADLPFAVIVRQPIDQRVTERENFDITVGFQVSGPARVMRQVSDDDGQTWRTVGSSSVGGPSSEGTHWISRWTDTATAATDGRLLRLLLEEVDGEESLISEVARMTVEPLPLYVAMHPASAAVIEGNTTTLRAASGMTLPTTQQWERSDDGGTTWVAIDGETGLTLSAGPMTPEMDGLQYRMLFTGVAGPVWSDAATLTIRLRTAPVVTAHPQSSTFPPGHTVVLTSFGADPGYVASVWQSSPDGVEWNDLILAPADAPLAAVGLLYLRTSPDMDGMRYRTVFTNHLGTATSDPALLTITAAPVISEHPMHTSVIQGQPATFSAATPAVSPNRSQQWQSSTVGETWTDVPGATGASLTIDSTAVDQDGTDYRIVFTNATGATASEPATLTVHPLPPRATVSVTPTTRAVDQIG